MADTREDGMCAKPSRQIPDAGNGGFAPLSDHVGCTEGPRQRETVSMTPSMMIRAAPNLRAAMTF